MTPVLSYILNMFSIFRQSATFLTRAPLWRLAVICAAFLAAPATGSAQDLRLLMVERAGCYYCIVFKRDVAPIYGRSPEGQIAPLVHYDLRDPLPDGVTLAARAFVTPTFILLDAEGHEVDRLTGYPGDDFFWPYVESMIAKAQAGS